MTGPQTSLYILALGLIVVSVTPVPGRVPKVYNALITSNQNLEPSKAFPVYQPFLHDAFPFPYQPLYYPVPNIPTIPNLCAPVQSLAELKSEEVAEQKPTPSDPITESASPSPSTEAPTASPSAVTSSVTDKPAPKSVQPPLQPPSQPNELTLPPGIIPKILTEPQDPNSLSPRLFYIGYNDYPYASSIHFG